MAGRYSMAGMRARKLAHSIRKWLTKDNDLTIFRKLLAQTLIVPRDRHVGVSQSHIMKI
jgi:hypothetical protein